MYFEMRNVEVNYDRVAALRGISLALDEGEIITLIGANGAGKTTTMRAITGLVNVYNGEIWFDHQHIHNIPTPKIISLGISMVPEGRHVYPYMSVKDNLLMGAYLRKDRKEIYDDMQRIYEIFPTLKQRLKQQGGSLSGGEQQMVAIARALMTKPKLLLLDEPSLGLSPLLAREIAKAISVINKRDKVSVILVEQNARMALRISDRGYVMETGRIALHDHSENLRNNDYVRKLYLGG